MERTEINKTGASSSFIGFGSWAIGGKFWGGTDEKESITAIQYALDQGINLIDTAPIYGFGLSEEIVGKAIRKKRDKVILSTKCGLVWDNKKGVPAIILEGKRIYRYLAKDSIIEEIEKSLKRLKTDYIDIYYTHWPDKSTPLEETMEALLTLKKEGKIRAIGASNVNLLLLKKYIQSGGVDAIQAEYSVLNRRLENDILPFCVDQNIPICTYCSLGQGLLTGKMSPKYRFKADDMRSSMKSFSRENMEKTMLMNKKLQKIAHTYGINQTQLIIAWTLAQTGIMHVLLGMRNKQQVKENIIGGQITISNDDINLIGKIVKESGASFGLHT